MSLTTVAAPPAAPRNGPGQNGGNDAPEGRNSFDHLIGEGKAVASRNEARTPRAERAATDARPEAADQTADPAQDQKVDGAAAARVVGDGRKGGDGEDLSTGDPSSTTATGGSALLAWLQASTTHAAPAPTPVDVAVAKPGDAVGIARLVGSAALAITPDATKPAADGLAAVATAAGGAVDSGAAKFFHLPLLGAADGREPDKAAVAALDALVPKELAASPQAPAGGAEALAATAFMASTATATTGQDRAGAGQAIGLAALPSALQAPLDAQSRELPQRIGERVQWLVSAGVQEARLQLHPRDLGSVTVQVRIEAGSASVFFGAEHPAARAALEAALPQLREQFATGGLQLAQAQVSSQSGGWSFGGSQTWGERGSGGGTGTGQGYAEGEGADAAPGPVATRVVHIGLLDDYA